MAAPIWKDYNVQLASIASLYPDGLLYRIATGGTVIFQGRAYPRPGATNIVTRINDICANYLDHIFYLDESYHGRYRATFLVQAYISGGWSSISTVEFLNDWSYDHQYNPATDGLAFPVDKVISGRQMLLQSQYSASSITAYVHLANGTTVQVVLTIESPGDYNNDYNNDFARMVKDYDGAAILDMRNYPTAVSVDLGGIHYTVEQGTCNRYVIYYVNAYGGWDSLLIRGKATMADTITHYNRQMLYDNTKTYARGKQNYVNDLVRDFDFFTAWMNDVESSKMHHVLNATYIYLHDLVTDEVHPLILTGNRCIYKTFRNSGNKLMAYEINAALAQDRIRR